jgi:pimeloyl-ACP methyl ester carboxylesterase
MRSRIADLPVEITRPESSKFNHPLLLVHGLWTGSWIWERLTPYLAHRGWESWAPSLLAGARPLDFAQSVAALTRVASALDAVPVVVAHDAGVVLASAVAAQLPVPALIAIAPVVAPADAGVALPFYRWPRFWRSRAWGARLPPPRDVRQVAGAALDACRGRLVADSGALFRALAASRIRLATCVGRPGLVVSGGADPISPPAFGAALAARLAWEHRVIDARGHFLMLERGWEAMADEIHRWAVQRLGSDLLALLDDEEDG